MLHSSGRYPGYHGIIGNYMYDAENDMEFRLDKVNIEGDTTGNTSWWKGHVPLWITAQEAGKYSIYKVFGSKKLYQDQFTGIK